MLWNPTIIDYSFRVKCDHFICLKFWAKDLPFFLKKKSEKYNIFIHPEEKEKKKEKGGDK